jgi:hypothetical protein
LEEGLRIKEKGIARSAFATTFAKASVAKERFGGCNSLAIPRGELQMKNLSFASLISVFHLAEKEGM